VPTLPGIDQHEPVKPGAVGFAESVHGTSAEFATVKHFELKAWSIRCVEPDAPYAIASDCDHVQSALHLSGTRSILEDRSVNRSRRVIFMSRVVVWGAAGQLGRRIVAEAARRDHEVTAVVRRTETAPAFAEEVAVVAGDATSAESVAPVAKDADALVTAVSAPGQEIYRTVAETMVGVAAALPHPAPRIIHMGGGATLTTPDGTRILDLPSFPAEYLDMASGQAEALDFYQASSGVTWTYVSPPPVHYAVGERTGAYRIGLDQPVTGADGEARLSYEDMAVAVVDEIEHPQFLNARFTVGY
jgi:putative NADH-flavin reductase